MDEKNGEDYHTEFLIMLATWESAIRFVNEAADRRSEIETITLAKLLGWTSAILGVLAAMS